MASNPTNFPIGTSSFDTNGTYRKRKNEDSDFDTRSPCKIFLTEDKLIQNMQTLSIDLSEKKKRSDAPDDKEGDQTQVEFHQLLRDNLRKDDLQDHFMNQLCDFERKKMSMQIVPYIPIHPAQLTSNTHDEDDKEENQTKIPSSPVVTPIEKETDDHLFKKPSTPTPYIVEEPSESTTKRPSHMKRSYSQSQRSNSNLTVVELRNDTSTPYSPNDYLIFEPTTPSILDSATTNLNSSFSSIQISEYFDFFSFNRSKHFDQQLVNLSDPSEQMDEEITSMSSAAATQMPTEISSESISDSSEGQDETSTRKFDIKRLRDAFVNCVQPDQTLLLSEYVRAYEELCVFVASLGAVFEWATRDLAFKLLILKEHERLDPVNYRSIQSMIDYEIESGRVLTKDTSLFIQPGKALPNGCRTLLRLHRALAFISIFLGEMRLAPDDASSASIAWNAYSVTLGRFHSWPVKHTIRAAIKLTIPNRQDLINKLLSKRSPEEIDIYAEEIVQACNIIDRTTQELFESRQMTKLS